MDKEYILNNLSFLSVQEIVKAIIKGVVSLDEIVESGQLESKKLNEVKELLFRALDEKSCLEEKLRQLAERLELFKEKCQHLQQELEREYARQKDSSLISVFYQRVEEEKSRLVDECRQLEEEIRRSEYYEGEMAFFHEFLDTSDLVSSHNIIFESALNECIGIDDIVYDISEFQVEADDVSLPQHAERVKPERSHTEKRLITNRKPKPKKKSHVAPWLKSLGSIVGKSVASFYDDLDEDAVTLSKNKDKEEPLPIPSTDSGDTVYSALYAPASAELKKWFKVQVHLYQESEEERTRQKALAMDKKAELMGFNPLSLKIERGTQVDAEITVYDDGVRVTKTARQLTWNGGLTSAVFEIKAEDSNLQSITGDVTLSVKGIPVGELTFNTDIVPSAQVDNTPKLGKTKQFDKAFISYSHDDVHTAEVAANILDTLGMCYFFDHHSLKSGAVFGEEIMQSIRESDVFILLWSEHAAQSDYVEKEYLYAKQFAYPQKPKEIATLVIKPYFIEPHADPPAELRIYNFSEMHTRH